jgi:hypothetical protein
MQNPQVPGILRLTPKIRRRIYEYTGVRERIVNLSNVMHNLGAFTFKDVMWRDYDAGPYYGLLLSCRAIYNEVIPLLYSIHWFVIRYQPNRTLSVLRAVRPLALASMFNLKIVLDQVSCHLEHPGCGEKTHCCHRLDLEKCCWRAQCLREPHTLIEPHAPSYWGRRVFAVILITGLDITICPSL